ncbi:MAG: hypothetical protein FWC61_00455 [Proteobacteria bacterium]|nr:hypothetical protein [Pseudomonadota bacterium]
MKKSIFITCGAALSLAGCCCANEYYNGNINYTQRGPDCVYAANQDGGRFTDSFGTSRSMRDAKTIVYRNTSCATIYARDASGANIPEPRPTVTYYAANPTQVVPAPAPVVQTIYVQTQAQSAPAVKKPVATATVKKPVVQAKPAVVATKPKCAKKCGCRAKKYNEPLPPPTLTTREWYELGY